ncbi:arylsulfatase J isoform X2 [Vespa velutina]|uniref:arylsulfatase J isoform X2 n=1 Tax=Vespa velutina TaxID=202808 RepID=UPI001FB257AE|nr:arylsulfatase J isoform X2 [Vespa velutina]
MKMTRLRVIVQCFSFIFLIFARLVNNVSSTNRPNIIFILADDLGWNDVGFHGSGQIPTPNIDALAYSGLLLDKYYVTPICTPSRSALMTGKYPIHNGMQHGVLKGAEPRGLPLNEKILPEYLQDLGYSTHIIGKWHLGFYKKEYTPTYRGFNSHVGYWSGHQDYFDHTAVEEPYWGLDMRRDMKAAWELHGQYSTDVFTQEAVQLIENHNSTQPLFLYLAHAAVHSGNPYNPLPAPDFEVARHTSITDYNRRRFAGGVRGAGLLWSPYLNHPGRISKQMIHITDWLPTILSIAGSDTSNLTNIDGINLWEALRDDKESPRRTILHNIDDIFGVSAITVGDWKLIQGSTYNGAWDGWYGPSGREWVYNVGAVIGGMAGRVITSLGLSLTPEKIHELRDNSLIKCPPKNDSLPACKPLEAACLFNVQQDPCEDNNLANELPTILKKLQDEVKKFNATAIPPGNLPWNEKADPKLWDHTWTNFGDYIDTMTSAAA